ncbi:hypothetical protein PIROE2DRAFT_15340, partial [Piromyces sp. E2]
TPTHYPNELERKSSIIKPVLLPSSSKNSGSFYELNPLDRNSNKRSGTLNTKYPVPLEPISKSGSHSSINNESSYVDNSYLPESPKLQTYRSQGEDILKTRKICVVNTPSNNLMNLIDGHTNNLSVNSLNQKVGTNETSNLSNSNSNTDNRTTKNNKKSKNNNKNKNNKSKNNKNGNSKISKPTTTYTAKKKKSLHPKQTETSNATKKLSSPTVLEQKKENKTSKKESPDDQKETIKTSNISNKNEDSINKIPSLGNTNSNKHSNNNINLNINDNTNIINKTKSTNTIDSNNNINSNKSNNNNNIINKNNSKSNVTSSLKSNSKEKNNRKLSISEKKNTTNNIIDNGNKTTKKKKAQTTTGKGKTTSTTTTKTTKDSNKKTTNNTSKKTNVSNKSKIKTEINNTNELTNKIPSSINDTNDKTPNKPISSSDNKDISKVETTINNNDNMTKASLLSGSISDNKTIQPSTLINDDKIISGSNGPTTTTATATTNSNLNSIEKPKDNNNNNSINSTTINTQKDKNKETTSTILSSSVKDTKNKNKESISTTTSSTVNEPKDKIKESKNTSKVTTVNPGLEDKPKGPKIPFSRRSSIDPSKAIGTPSTTKKKEERKSSINEKTEKSTNTTKNKESKQVTETTLDPGKLPTLPNMTSKPSNYLKPKTAQQMSVKQPSVSSPSPISPPPQTIRKPPTLSTVDFGQTYFNDAVKPPIFNHDPKGIYQGINNLYSDSGGKAPPLSESMDTTKNHQTTLGKAKLPALPDFNTPTPKISSTPAVKTSAISGNINFNDVFSLPNNNKLTPLSPVNANSKINYLMEKENQHSQESSNGINNFPQSRPIRTVLKPIQLTSDLPFGNETVMEEVNFKKKLTPLDNIPSKPAIQVLQPLKSHNQIMPDCDNQSLNPIAKLPKIQRESPLPMIRKTKK